MKTKPSLLKQFFYIMIFLALSPEPCALSQIPQGFNYQAIARDGSGNPISTLIDVKIAILTSESDLDVIWEEEHTGVDPDDHGLFSIVVGEGTDLPGGLASVSEIDWSETPLYIRTKINDVKLGTAQLWSVPYSMISGDLGGSVKKLEVMGEDETSDEALFEVKRKDGELMFGVYNHGVRINMPLDTLSKTRKGGFIVAGFDNIKGVVQDYLVVNPDSIRAYIDTNPGKTRKGGFAVGGFEEGKQTPEEYLRVTRDSTRVYLNDTGTKTRKGGFAVGGFDAAKQDIQDFLLVSPDSVRVFLKETDTKTRKGGFAISGYDNTKGITNDYFNVDIDTNSTIDPSENRILWYPLKNAFLTGKVLIEDRDSVGENSFASGYESKAIGDYSQALGYKAIARSDYSTAIGKNAVADSINSFAFGEDAMAKNDESYAIGRGAVASGYRSFAFGSAGVDQSGNPTDVAKALGDYSFAIGAGAYSSGEGSISFSNSKSFGEVSIAMGDGAVANSDCSICIGIDAETSGIFSTAIGMDAEASNWHTYAIGWNSSASGDCSMSIGMDAEAIGDYSSAFGHYARTEGLYSTAIGGSKAAGEFSTAIGDGAWAIGQFSTAFGKSVRANGQFSQALGRDAQANGKCSLVTGWETIAPSAFETVIGSCNTNYTPQSVTEWNASDRLFVIGNGTSSLESYRSDAIVLLKNGNFGIGSSSPTAKLEVNLANSSGWSGNLKALRFYSPDNGYYLDLNTSIISAGNTGYHFNPNGNTGLTISTPGNVGIGTTNPSQKLHVNGDIRLEGGGIQNLSGGVGVGFTSTGWYSDVGNLATRIPSASGDLYVQTSGGASTYLRVGPGIGGMELFVGKAVFDNAVGIATSSVGTYKLYVNGTAYSTGGWSGSDFRWKKNILPLNTVLSSIQHLIPVSYEWRKDDYPEINFDDGRQIGLIAQEVEKIFPELVKTDDNGYKAVAYEKLSVVLLAGIKEQQQKIESQQQQIDELSGLIIEMRSEIASLRSQ